LSFVAGGAIGAIIAILVSQGFQQVRAETNGLGDTIVRGIDQNGKPVSVQLKNNAIISPQFDFARISASQTEASDEESPNFEFKNESSIIKRIFALSIVPDATFKSEGFIKILLNDTQMFPVSTLAVGSFQDVSAINIPIPDTYGLKILPKRELKVFIWSDTGATVSATIAVFVGELP